MLRLIIVEPSVKSVQAVLAIGCRKNIPPRNHPESTGSPAMETLTKGLDGERC
jgi:hypothetical protein